MRTTSPADLKVLGELGLALGHLQVAHAGLKDPEAKLVPLCGDDVMNGVFFDGVCGLEAAYELLEHEEEGFLGFLAEDYDFGDAQLSGVNGSGGVENGSRLVSQSARVQ